MNCLIHEGLFCSIDLELAIHDIHFNLNESSTRFDAQVQETTVVLHIDMLPSYKHVIVVGHIA